MSVRGRQRAGGHTGEAAVRAEAGPGAAASSPGWALRGQKTPRCLIHGVTDDESTRNMVSMLSYVSIVTI